MTWSRRSGPGPLDPLLVDETITEIMVNGPDHSTSSGPGRSIESIATS